MAKEDFIEVGATGLKQYSGYVNEEFISELRGRQGAKTYKEMADNDPIVGAILFAIEMLLRNAGGRVEPVSKDPADIEVADFVESCLGDMEHSWGEFEAEKASKYTYGWAYHEIVFKRRLGGKQTDPSKKSKYNDGKIGIRKLPIRAQDSILRWEIDKSGDILGMHQSIDGIKTAYIPLDKSMLFRTTSTKNNPEGRSILRNGYKPYYLKKKIEMYEAIGVERDLAGLPVLRVDYRLMKAAASGDSAAQSALDEYKTIGRNIRNDEQACVVMPEARDENGHRLYDIELLSSGGSKTFDTNAIIQRYDTRISQTVLADFIMLGNQPNGSRSLSSDKTTLFATALGTWQKADAEIITNKLFRKLCEVNNIPTDRCPKYIPNDIEKADVELAIKSINDSIMSGALELTDKVYDKTRELLDIQKD